MANYLIINGLKLCNVLNISELANVSRETLLIISYLVY
jgi:hypothetical protein